jgi:hypothetical protein
VDFATMAVINPPERKLAKRISVLCIEGNHQIYDLVAIYSFSEFPPVRLVLFG